MNKIFKLINAKNRWLYFRSVVCGLWSVVCVCAAMIIVFSLTACSDDDDSEKSIKNDTYAVMEITDFSEDFKGKFIIAESQYGEGKYIVAYESVEVQSDGRSFITDGAKIDDNGKAELKVWNYIQTSPYTATLNDYSRDSTQPVTFDVWVYKDKRIDNYYVARGKVEITFTDSVGTGEFKF